MSIPVSHVFERIWPRLLLSLLDIVLVLIKIIKMYPKYYLI